VFLKLAVVTQTYSHPVGREGNEAVRFGQSEAVSGREIYTLSGVPKEVLGLSTTKISMASFRVFRSVIRWESLACARSSAGFRTMTTAAASTAKIAMTINNSTKVKDDILLRGII
jgi:hypothetical protein